MTGTVISSVTVLVTNTIGSSSKVTDPEQTKPVVFSFGEKIENEGKAVMVLLLDKVAVVIFRVPVSETPSETVAVSETFLEAVLEPSAEVLNRELMLPVS